MELRQNRRTNKTSEERAPANFSLGAEQNWKNTRQKNINVRK